MPRAARKAPPASVPPHIAEGLKPTGAKPDFADVLRAKRVIASALREAAAPADMQLTFGRIGLWLEDHS